MEHVYAKDLDLASGNFLSGGTKVVVNNKIYNVYGFSEAKDYLIIFSATPENGFLIGGEFYHTIPPTIKSCWRFDKTYYYKKISFDDVEDIYAVNTEITYNGIFCSYEFSGNWSVNICVDSNNKYHYGQELDESLLQKWGFKSKWAGDTPGDYRKIYIKDNVSFLDPKLVMHIYMNYAPKLAYPYSRCKRNYADKKIEINIDLKQTMIDILHGKGV